MTPVNPRNIGGKTRVTCFYEFFVLEEFLESSFEGLSLPSRFETDLSASVSHLEDEREEIQVFLCHNRRHEKSPNEKKFWQPRLAFKVIFNSGLHSGAPQTSLILPTQNRVAPSVKLAPNKKLEKRTWERAFELAPLLLPGAEGASWSITGDTPFTDTSCWWPKEIFIRKRCRWVL